MTSPTTIRTGLVNHAAITSAGWSCAEHVYAASLNTAATVPLKRGSKGDR